jgi:hypothetical protein
LEILDVMRWLERGRETPAERPLADISPHPDE